MPEPAPTPLHHGPIALGAHTSPGAPADLPAPTARFVHYPDCQQLQYWLPAPGREYTRLSLAARDGSAVFADQPVSERLSGSIQLLFDTAPLPPGQWRLEIHHRSGFRHVLDLDKAEFVEPAPPPPPPAPNQASNAPIQYRDGTGRPLQSQDPELRAAHAAAMARRAGRHLEYSGTFRAGTVTYVEGDLRIAFDHEMGGGSVHCYVDLPRPERWEAATRTPLARRAEIVQFVADTLQREQAPSWRCEIREDAILFR